MDSTCTGTSNVCIAGECKCGTAPPCTGNSNTCDGGTCKCGTDAPCVDTSNICDGSGTCKCGVDDPCTQASGKPVCSKNGMYTTAADATDTNAQCYVSKYFVVIFIGLSPFQRNVTLIFLYIFEVRSNLLSPKCCDGWNCERVRYYRWTM